MFTEEANHRTESRASTTFKSDARPEYRESLRLLHLRGISVSGAAFASPEKYHKAATRFKFCGSSVRLNEWADNSTGEVKQTFAGGKLCGQRLCPKCQHIKARIVCDQIGKVHKAHLEEAPDSIGVLLTLTMRNCEPSALRSAVQHMHHSFGKLRRRVEFEGAVRGFFRATEITVSKASGQRSYHPHMHVMLMVPRSYLRKSSGLFITQERWVQMWQECLGVDYRPIVDVRAITPEAMGRRVGRKGGALTMAGAIREVAKYCVKPDGYQEILPSGRFWTDPEVFQELQEGLRSLRLFAWGGALDAIRKDLQLKDVEGDIDLEAELENVEKPPQNYTLIAQVVYNWDDEARGGWGDYVELFRRDILQDIDIFNESRFKGGG